MALGAGNIQALADLMRPDEDSDSEDEKVSDNKG
jgi:hypothetical protein